MLSLHNFHYEGYFQNAEMAAQGVQAVLKDLLEAMARAEEKVEAGSLSATVVINAVTRLQQLVSSLGRSSVFTQLEGMRRRLERRLGDWSSARFESARVEIEQMLNTGDVSGAVQAAERLKERVETAGDA